MIRRAVPADEDALLTLIGKSAESTGTLSTASGCCGAFAAAAR
jgi:hypothetical protein